MTARIAALFSIILIYTYASFGSIPFLRDKDSPFPSGISSKIELNKRIVDSFSEIYYFIETENDGHYWLNEDEGISWKHLASELVCGKDTPLYSGRNTTKEPTGQCKKNTKLKVLGYQNHRFRVSTPSGLTKWIPWQSLSWSKNSLGYAYLKKDTHLKNTKDSSKIWLKSPVKLKILRYVNNGLFLKFGGDVFYADRSNFISPINLASRIKFKSGKKYSFTVEGGNLKIKNKSFKIPGRPLLVFNNRKIISLPTTNFYHFDGVKFLKLHTSNKSEAYIATRKKEELWHQSRLRKHGLVYWTNYKHLKDSELLSDKAVLDREIYDMASSPLDRKLILASGDGVYRKLAPNQWEEIERFEGMNLPIHFSESGRLFVGPYKSDNQGGSFQSYVAWHKVLQGLKTNKKMNKKNIKITQIKSLDKDGEQLKLLISDGKNSLWVKANLKTQNWEAL